MCKMNDIALTICDWFWEMGQFRSHNDFSKTPIIVLFINNSSIYNSLVTLTPNLRN